MIRVVAAVIEGIGERRGRLLICQRRLDDAFGGQWEFPGGKMRPSETPRAALERELREELDVAARIGEELRVIRYRYPGAAQDHQIRFFRASLAMGWPRNVLCGRIAWVRRQDLPRYRFLAADLNFVARLAHGEFS